PPATVLDATYIEYSLPPPQRRSSWVEDVPEEDSDGISLHHNDNSILASFDQTPPCNLAEIDKTDSITSTELGDGLVQSVALKEIREGKLCEASNILQASLALKNLMDTLRGPLRGKGGGYKKPDLDPFVYIWLEGMHAFLNLYTNSQSATYEKWAASSFQASIGLGRGRYCTCTLCCLACAYVHDCIVLPINSYGDWNETSLVDEDLCNDIMLYLQELGNNITAQKLVEYLSRPEVKKKHGIARSISLRTAQHYLKLLGFCFCPNSKG
ncbi:hypothetical protein C0995_004483, partial [Termitomyces sp. Mi166